MKLSYYVKTGVSIAVVACILCGLSSCKKSSRLDITKEHLVVLDISKKPLDANLNWKPILGTYQKMEGNPDETFSIRENALELLLTVGNKEFVLTQVTYKEYICKQDNALNLKNLHFIVDKKGFSALCKVGEIYYEHITYADNTFDFANFTPPPVAIKKDFPGLVPVKEIDPTMSVNLRFTPKQTAYLTKETAEALKRANQALQTTGYALILLDAYRPKSISIQKETDDKFQTGDTVSVMLFNTKSQQESDMGSSYLELSIRSKSDYIGGTSLQRWHRSFLKNAMTLAGFVSNESMWWQFTYPKK
jgi:hypothetical protein